MTRLSLTLCVVVLAACAAPPQVARDEADAPEDEVDVGYGAVPASHVTGAVSQVRPTEGDLSGAATILDLLVARVPGLRVQTTPNGQPGIVIRGVSSIYGSNEPLVVLDGTTLFDARGLLQINPRDVASVSVLKGSEASIYGSRGGNGVILIRTKR